MKTNNWTKIIKNDGKCIILNNVQSIDRNDIFTVIKTSNKIVEIRTSIINEVYHTPDYNTEEQ